MAALAREATVGDAATTTIPPGRPSSPPVSAEDPLGIAHAFSGHRMALPGKRVIAQLTLLVREALGQDVTRGDRRLRELLHTIFSLGVGLDGGSGSSDAKSIMEEVLSSAACAGLSAPGGAATESEDENEELPPLSE